MQAALESEIVSCSPHHWISLVFGYQVDGPAAVAAANKFSAASCSRCKQITLTDIQSLTDGTSKTGA